MQLELGAALGGRVLENRNEEFALFRAAWRHAAGMEDDVLAQALARNSLNIRNAYIRGHEKIANRGAPLLCGQQGGCEVWIKGGTCRQVADAAR